MKTVILLAVLSLLIMLIPGFQAEACWAYLSTEDLVEQSDLIVIGEIKGISGTEQVEGMWVTSWNVAVHYYLKGSPDSSMLAVFTPGARNKEPLTSIYYRLDEWGSTVLLFLAEREGRLEPLSPQGVVALELEYSPEEQEPAGEYLINNYIIIDQKTDAVEKQALESYLAGLPQVTAAPSTIIDIGSGFSSSRYILPAVLLILALAGLIKLFWNIFKINNTQ